MPAAWKEAALECLAGARLRDDQGLALLRDAPLNELGRLAAQVRHRLHPAREVTFAIDTNPNYSNICVTDCAFCAFYRRPGDPEGYVLTVEEVMEKIATAVRQGATTVLLQGGHNPALPFEYYLSLVRETRRRFPGVTPHFFTCSEIEQMAAVSSLSTRRVLEELHRAGQVTLPGGGAEILSDRVRRRLAPKKGPTSAWIGIMREAHQVGMRSTATMMYGHLEEDEDILEHLERVRALQDETGGFTAFVPWSFKKGNTPLEARLEARGFRPAGAARYLRILALARIYLDNVPHLQASWFGEGKKTGQIALHFGADDFGGTLIEENVHLATGHDLKTTVKEIKILIREAGFTPVQRTTLYGRIEERSPAAPAT
jgi:cyclic dehypoxanthinyl futalosine synthase